jgi:hypothetical protein
VSDFIVSDLLLSDFIASSDLPLSDFIVSDFALSGFDIVSFGWLDLSASAPELGGVLGEGALGDALGDCVLLPALSSALSFGADA